MNDKDIQDDFYTMSELSDELAQEFESRLCELFNIDPDKWDWETERRSKTYMMMINLFRDSLKGESDE